RKIMGWDVSNTMNAEWCRDVLVDTIQRHGKPEIFNADQGSQFTSEGFVKASQKNEVKVSMDGKGRALDNINIERCWGARTSEKKYLNPPNGGVDLDKQIKEYVSFYNSERRHKSLARITPDEKFYQEIKNVS